MVVVTINILVKPQLSRGVHPLVARLVLLPPGGPVESEEAKRTTIKSKITLIKCLLCLKKHCCFFIISGLLIHEKTYIWLGDLSP